jgi:hypothetical protein
MNAETFLISGPRQQAAGDFLLGSAEDFLGGAPSATRPTAPLPSASGAGGVLADGHHAGSDLTAEERAAMGPAPGPDMTPGLVLHPDGRREVKWMPIAGKLSTMGEARKQSLRSEIDVGRANLGEYNTWLKEKLTNPAAGLVPLTQMAPSAQTARNAFDVLGAAGLAMTPTVDPERARSQKELMERPDAEPDTASKVTAGAIKVALGIPESMTSPAAVATMGASAAVQRGAALAFLADTGRHTPEAARAAGAASVEGDAQEMTEAIGGLALNF